MWDAAAFLFGYGYGAALSERDEAPRKCDCDRHQRSETVESLLPLPNDLDEAIRLIGRARRPGIIYPRGDT